ncbi:hypothetical protein R9C00_23295 [Flammeovirgaceae bacterium SG7u.111]|nr:hypothetical protein [Flammeovirgaceae bacterium SG7u.132]WPO34632.1 hypothetical protein R9C00_23295 [Flammeovirgaceae bacterium SG7u.111]
MSKDNQFFANGQAMPKNWLDQLFKKLFKNTKDHEKPHGSGDGGRKPFPPFPSQDPKAGFHGFSTNGGIGTPELMETYFQALARSKSIDHEGTF